MGWEVGGVGKGRLRNGRRMEAGHESWARDDPS